MWKNIKSGQVTFRQHELKKFMDKKLSQLAALLTHLTLALTIISILVIMDYFKVPDMYLFALILIPVVGRGFVITWYDSWLRKTFSELLDE